MNRGASRSVAMGTAALLVIAGIAGCGRTADRLPKLSAEGGLKPMPVSDAPSLSTDPPSRLRRAAEQEVGATQWVDASGARLGVTLRRVIDPLLRSGAQLPGGARAVGVVVQIRNSGPKLYDSSATGDITLVASKGVVTPVFATHGICRTPLDDFDRYITVGEDRLGCVVFAVANGATLDAVRFSPHARRLGRLTWAP